MCGRFTLVATGEAVRAEFGLDEWPAAQGARYNIAPTQEVAALLSAGGRRVLAWPRWGLVPAWSGEESNGPRLINARAETVQQKPAFRTAFRDRRCLVLADGFYEWQRAPHGKVPVRVRRRDAKPFAFAGLWERRQREGGEPLLTCAIITTAASEVVRAVHDRMPVILAAGERDAWLDDAMPSSELSALLQPRATPELEAYAVSALVNSPRHDVPACIAPV